MPWCLRDIRHLAEEHPKNADEQLMHGARVSRGKNQPTSDICRQVLSWRSCASPAGISYVLRQLQALLYANVQSVSRSARACDLLGSML
eukprot:8026956-Heterocapsa_arctica.AAC.1